MLKWLPIIPSNSTALSSMWMRFWISFLSSPDNRFPVHKDGQFNNIVFYQLLLFSFHNLSVKRKAPTPVVSNIYFGPRLHFAPSSQSLATDNTHSKIRILAVICSAKVHCPENTTSNLEKSFPVLAPNLRDISLSDKYWLKYKN